MHLFVFLLFAPFGDASSFGKSLALVGDLDGDRCSEIAVGSPSDGEGRRGKVFLFSGKHGGSVRELQGDVENGGFGTDVAGVGDQDGDRVPDFAVGSPFVRGEGCDGRVAIVSGKDGKTLRVFRPEKGEHYFGIDLEAVGDLDGDGKVDLLVRARAGAGTDERERFVAVSAASGARLFAVESPPGVLSRELGRPMAKLFDLDGDGVPDFAVEFGLDVHVRSGKDGKELRSIASPIPPSDRSRFGYSICGVRGKKPSIAVGDPADDVHGTVRIFPVDLKSAPGAAAKEDGGALLAGEKDFAGVGQSLATIGDLDGDGVDEIAVGWSDGKLGGVLLLSGKDLSPARPIQDEPEDGRLPIGYRVAAGLDVDGDGRPDVAVSRHWPTASAKAKRSVAVFSGADGKKIRELLSPEASAPDGKKPGR
jgi:hypothetical protein